MAQVSGDRQRSHKSDSYEHNDAKVMEDGTGSEIPLSLDEKNLVYSNGKEEPEIHLRTWVAVASMLLLNYVQVLALQSPPAVVRADALHTHTDTV